MRMQARLLLSHDIFSFEKKPTIWCFCTGGGGGLADEWVGVSGDNGWMEVGAGGGGGGV